VTEWCCCCCCWWWWWWWSEGCWARGARLLRVFRWRRVGHSFTAPAAAPKPAFRQERRV